MDKKSILFALVASLLLGATCAVSHGSEAIDTSTCNKITLDFIIKDDDPDMAAVEDDIVQDLAKIGIKINTRKLNATEFREAELKGDFNLMFTATWGAPYDPHSYLNSWSEPAHVEYSAVGNMEKPLTREGLMQEIADVQVETDPVETGNKWGKILQDVHSQAIFLPLWGTRIPYVLNRRLGGFTPSAQVYDYPIASLKVFEGSKNVTIAPGAGGFLFSKTGPIHPHQYFPNQLFAQAWVYEPLVEYGQDGEIGPALAASWKIEDTASGGSRYTFTLRSGVKFHDGSDWNCAVAKLNFDHVLSDKVKVRHAWCRTSQQLTSWTCDSSGRFVLETKEKYYPLLQELSYIRPLRFAAATAFKNGLNSDPVTENSCNTGDFGSKYTYIEDSVTCGGLKPLGTGPFKVVDIDKAVFARHEEYWGPVPDINFIHIKTYEKTTEIMADLQAGALDMALGTGPLEPAQVETLKFYHSDVVDVRHGEIMQHSILIMNTNAAGTQDINIRRAVIHGIDKARFIKKEFNGLLQPVSQLLPSTAPYCDVDLTPKWSYDFEKARLLNCPAAAPRGGLPVWGTVIIVVVSVLLVGVLAFLGIMYSREKQGKPIFVKLDSDDPEASGIEGKIMTGAAPGVQPMRT